jgi:hypothetical protein
VPPAQKTGQVLVRTLHHPRRAETPVLSGEEVGYVRSSEFRRQLTGKASFSAATNFGSYLRVGGRGVDFMPAVEGAPNLASRGGAWQTLNVYMLRLRPRIALRSRIRSGW